MSEPIEPMLIPDGDDGDDGPVPPKEPPPKDGFNPAFFRPDRPRRRFEHRDRHHRHERYDRHERRGRDRFRDRSRSREAHLEVGGGGIKASFRLVMQWNNAKNVGCGYQKLLDIVILYDYIMLCTDQVEWYIFL